MFRKGGRDNIIGVVTDRDLVVRGLAETGTNLQSLKVRLWGISLNLLLSCNVSKGSRCNDSWSPTHLRGRLDWKRKRLDEFEATSSPSCFQQKQQQAHRNSQRGWLAWRTSMGRKFFAAVATAIPAFCLRSEAMRCFPFLGLNNGETQIKKDVVLTNTLWYLYYKKSTKKKKKKKEICSWLQSQFLDLL